MRKQTVILTTWLTLPFIILTLLMVWIFISLDKDKLMADAPPVGAGAGDTGNANALGQWIAGRDPDEVSRANEARRQGTLVNPFSWPGGTLIAFEHTPEPQFVGLKMEARVVVRASGSTSVLWPIPEQLGENRWGVQLKHYGPDVSSVKIAVGYKSEKNKETEWPMIMVPMTLLNPVDTLSSDPIEVSIRINVVDP